MRFAIVLTIFLLANGFSIFAQTSSGKAGTAEEPVKYIGTEIATEQHNGGLRPVVGVKNYQIMRANREHPEWGDGFGWTLNHAPMIAYWNNKFYVEYLSDPVGEHVPPMQTIVMTSADGKNWDKPQIVFPQYKLKDGGIALMHQRMGFYVAPNGRFLVLGFYGFAPSPNNGTGIGRVAREIYKDGTFGPIYFVKYNTHRGFSEKNTNYPFYTSSTDEGFKEAVKSLMSNKLVTLQMWEEDRNRDGFYALENDDLKALSFYHRKDGAVVGLWKNAWSSLSFDEGKTWSKPIISKTIITNSAKTWGQKTKDGRYAIAYNPTYDNRHRYPLAVVTGEDGIQFDNLLSVHGEVSWRRYNGEKKNLGAQYVRGIVEGNGIPPGNFMWLTYSMNKEDIWVSQVPLPIRGAVTKAVKDDFNTVKEEDLEWNIYSPQWAQVKISDFPGNGNKSLELRDEDPFEYARIERVFPETTGKVTMKFKVLAKQNNTGRMEIEVLDRHGHRPPVRLFFDDKGQILAMDATKTEITTVGQYKPDTWYEFILTVDNKEREFDLAINGKTVLEKAEIIDPVKSIERLSFRTGEYRSEPTYRTPSMPGEDLPGAGEKAPLTVFYIDDVEINPEGK